MRLELYLELGSKQPDKIITCDFKLTSPEGIRKRLQHFFPLLQVLYTFAFLSTWFQFVSCFPDLQLANTYVCLFQEFRYIYSTTSPLFISILEQRSVQPGMSLRPPFERATLTYLYALCCTMPIHSYSYTMLECAPRGTAALQRNQSDFFTASKCSRSEGKTPRSCQRSLDVCVFCDSYGFSCFVVVVPYGALQPQAASRRRCM